MAGHRRKKSEVYCTIDGCSGRVCSQCGAAKLLQCFRVRTNGVTNPSCRACERAVREGRTIVRAAQPECTDPRERERASRDLAVAFGYPAWTMTR